MSGTGDNNWPRTDDELTAEAAAFAAEHEPASKRWGYVVARMQKALTLRSGKTVTGLRKGGADACIKFLGVHLTEDGLRRRLLRHLDMGFKKADEWFSRYGGNGLAVGPVRAWTVGHVYVLRVASHPDVMKIGFSRRVLERVADLRSKTGTKLDVAAVTVGTLMDEHWWHDKWSDHRISGEWFFHPHAEDRSLPDFLKAVAA